MYVNLEPYNSATSSSNWIIYDHKASICLCIKATVINLKFYYTSVSKCDQGEPGGLVFSKITWGVCFEMLPSYRNAWFLKDDLLAPLDLQTGYEVKSGWTKRILFNGNLNIFPFVMVIFIGNIWQLADKIIICDGTQHCLDYGHKGNSLERHLRWLDIQIYYINRRLEFDFTTICMSHKIF